MNQYNGVIFLIKHIIKYYTVPDYMFYIQKKNKDYFAGMIIEQITGYKILGSI